MPTMKYLPVLEQCGECNQVPKLERRRLKNKKQLFAVCKCGRREIPFADEVPNGQT